MFYCGPFLKKIFIEFVTILLLFYAMVFWPQGTWDLSSGTGDQTHHPLQWEAKSKTLDFQRSPKKTLLIPSLLITSLSHSLHIVLNFLNHYPLTKPPAREMPPFPWVTHFIFLTLILLIFLSCLNCFEYQKSLLTVCYQEMEKNL